MGGTSPSWLELRMCVLSPALCFLVWLCSAAYVTLFWFQSMLPQMPVIVKVATVSVSVLISCPLSSVCLCKVCVCAHTRTMVLYSRSSLYKSATIIPYRFLSLDSYKGLNVSWRGYCVYQHFKMMDLFWKSQPLNLINRILPLLPVTWLSYPGCLDFMTGVHTSLNYYLITWPRCVSRFRVQTLAELLSALCHMIIEWKALYNRFCKLNVV